MIRNPMLSSKSRTWLFRGLIVAGIAFGLFSDDPDGYRTKPPPTRGHEYFIEACIAFFFCLLVPVLVWMFEQMAFLVMSFFAGVAKRRPSAVSNLSKRDLFSECFSRFIFGLGCGLMTSALWRHDSRFSAGIEFVLMAMGLWIGLKISRLLTNKYRTANKSG